MTGEGLEHVACDLCGSDRNIFLYYTEESSHPRAAAALRGNRRLAVVRCRNCGLVFVNPRYSRTFLRRMYADPSLYASSTDPDGRPRDYMREKESKQWGFRALISALERRRAGGRLLDVGCGPGFFLELLGPQWTGAGIDLSPFAAGYARETLGLNVSIGDFESATFMPASFDVVVMLQVLDHLPSPRRALAIVHEILTDGGLLVLSDLVNIDSLCSRIFRDGYRLLAPNHLYYFSPKTIRRLLTELGFGHVTVEFPYFRTPYFKWKEIVRFIIRAIQSRVMNPILGSRQKVASPPFYGNVMTVWARKAQ